MKMLLDSPGGIVLKTGLSRENADILKAELQHDSSVQVLSLRDEESCVAVLVGYRPGSRGRLRAALQKLSRLPTEEVIRFLASIPIAVKSNTDRATAESVKTILERAGGIVEIRTAEGLIGVLSRKSQSSLHSQVKDASSVFTGHTSPLSGGQSSAIEDADSSFFRPSSPPFVSGGGMPGASTSFRQPSVIDFSPPPCNSGAIPAVIGEIGDNEGQTEPYPIWFTIPGSSIPQVQQVEYRYSFMPPDRTDCCRIIPVFLFPVAQSDRDRIRDLLCCYLNVSPQRALGFIDRAPVAVAGFADMKRALAVLKELFDLGIPVSLVSGSNSPKEPSPAKTFFGWLNGYGRTP